MEKLTSLHSETSAVSAKILFSATEGKVISLQLLKGGLLDKHTTKVPALLLCVSGEAVYEDEQDRKHTLRQGEFTPIEPMVVHWVRGVEDSELLLMK